MRFVLSTVTDARSPPTMLVMMINATISGAQGDVVLPVGSYAHELRGGNSAWVARLAIPLSKTGQCDDLARIFPSLFLGDDPRLVLHKVPADATSASGQPDWASLVALMQPFRQRFRRQVQLARRRAADLAQRTSFNRN